MEKVSLNKFTQVANFDYIEEPKLILSVVREKCGIFHLTKYFMQNVAIKIPRRGNTFTRNLRIRKS